MPGALGSHPNLNGTLRVLTMLQIHGVFSEPQPPEPVRKLRLPTYLWGFNPVLSPRFYASVLTALFYDAIPRHFFGSLAAPGLRDRI